MSRYAVLVTNYPTDKDPESLGFVHSRVKGYKKNGLTIDVLKISNDKACEYEYEDVHVYQDKVENLLHIANTNKYSKILVHFLSPVMNPIITKYKIVAWVHGVEALHWKRRLFNLSWKFPKYIYKNHKQLAYFKSVVETKDDISFVFVSQWMRHIATADLKTEIRKYSIIPNFIDTNFYKFEKKPPEQRKNILLIRSFGSRKYANDISVKIIQELSNKHYFSDLKFTIYGKGKYFDNILKPIRNYENVTINNRFLNHEEIRHAHEKNGIFLCPTRQDAQGVSMCEAMSSGCVPVTSLNTAIPEFVSDDAGFLCENKDITSFIAAIDALQDVTKFSEMSFNSRKCVENKCCFEKTIGEEIKLITG